MYKTVNVYDEDNEHVPLLKEYSMLTIVMNLNIYTKISSINGPLWA